MKKSGGFTLIELMIVVAIIGVLAAIAIPNLIDALNNSRQKKSMAEIRTMVLAMQTFSVDFGGYPNESYIGSVQEKLSTVNDYNGDPVMVPDYIQNIPAMDGWGNSYQYFSGPDGTTGNAKLEGSQVTALHYCVYSLGLAGSPGGGTDGSGPAPDVVEAYCATPSVKLGIRSTTCFESDIVWGDSSFQQSPEGKQKKCGD